MQNTVQSVLNMKELRSTRSKGLEVPCQNTLIHRQTCLHQEATARCL